MLNFLNKTQALSKTNCPWIRFSFSIIRNWVKNRNAVSAQKGDYGQTLAVISKPSFTLYSFSRFQSREFVRVSQNSILLSTASAYSFCVTLTLQWCHFSFHSLYYVWDTLYINSLYFPLIANAHLRNLYSSRKNLLQLVSDIRLLNTIKQV